MSSLNDDSASSSSMSSSTVAKDTFTAGGVGEPSSSSSAMAASPPRWLCTSVGPVARALGPPDACREGEIVGGALGLNGGARPVGASSPVCGVGEDALLVLAGGRPVGVEGGALFLPFLGGVVDIQVSEYENLEISDWLRATSQIGR